MILDVKTMFSLERVINVIGLFFKEIEGDFLLVSSFKIYLNFVAMVFNICPFNILLLPMRMTINALTLPVV
jgi:hypothetical protein